jgi:hypothetical protein
MLINNSTGEILDIGAWWRRNPVAVELELPETLCFPETFAFPDKMQLKMTFLPPVSLLM